MGQSRPLFLFIFVFSGCHIVVGVLGIRTRGSRMKVFLYRSLLLHLTEVIMAQLPTRFFRQLTPLLVVQIGFILAVSVAWLSWFELVSHHQF